MEFEDEHNYRSNTVFFDSVLRFKTSLGYEQCPSPSWSANTMLLTTLVISKKGHFAYRVNFSLWYDEHISFDNAKMNEYLHLIYTFCWKSNKQLRHSIRRLIWIYAETFILTAASICSKLISSFLSWFSPSCHAVYYQLQLMTSTFLRCLGTLLSFYVYEKTHIAYKVFQSNYSRHFMVDLLTLALTFLKWKLFELATGKSAR